MVFRARMRDSCTQDVVRFSDRVKKQDLAAGECIFTPSEGRATPQVLGSHYPERKTI